MSRTAHCSCRLGVASRCSDIVDRLRWLLGPDERLVAIVGEKVNFWRVKRGYAVFTDERIPFLHDVSFLKRGEVAREYP